MLKRIIFYVVTFIGIILLHQVIINSIVVWNVSPSIFFITVVFAGIYRGMITGELAGFALGLIVDTLSVELFGINAFCFTIVGFLSGLVSRKLDVAQARVQAVFLYIASVVYIALYATIYSVFSDLSNGFSFKMLVLLPILNAAFTPAIIWLFHQWVRLWGIERVRY